MVALNVAWIWWGLENPRETVVEMRQMGNPQLSVGDVAGM
jgi:hypothetical protein